MRALLGLSCFETRNPARVSAAVARLADISQAGSVGSAVYAELPITNATCAWLGTAAKPIDAAMPAPNTKLTMRKYALSASWDTLFC